MFYKALARVFIRPQPDPNSSTETRMQKDEIGVTIETNPVNGFVKLAVLSSSRQGWVKMADEEGPLLEEIAPPALTDFELPAFLPACVDAEDKFNRSANNKTGFFVIADFLIAWADIATGIKNLAGVARQPGPIGPFQISAEDWQRFLDSPFGGDWGPPDRLDGLQQPFGAAFLALDTMSAISIGINTRDPVAGPYIPSYVDVLIAMMLGEKAAVEIRKAKIADNGTATIEAVLGPLFSADDLKRLIDFRGTVEKNRSIDKAETVNFLKDAKTVDDLLSNAENLLDSELQTAFALIKDKDPDDLPKLDGTAPWMAVAEEQLEDWTSSLKNETTSQGKARIIEYFGSFGAKANGTEAWCGAFVGYCLEKCNPSFATTVPKDAGWAPNWVNWGNVSVPSAMQPIPPGAIVTISPSKDTNKVGHVGFCHSSDPNQVTILGGNQSNTAKLSNFSRSSIVAIRWFSREESDAGRTAEQGSTGQVQSQEIAWGAKVSAEFKTRVVQISDALGCDPSHLMAAMAFETGETFSPKKVNPDSGATGLIQFLKSTAKDLGTTTSDLANMTAVAQLEFVQKYLQPFRGRMKTLSDVYMTILCQVAVGKPEAVVIFKSGTKEYDQNKGLDSNKDGQITKGEAVTKVQAELSKGLKDGRRA